MTKKRNKRGKSLLAGFFILLTLAASVYILYPRIEIADPGPLPKGIASGTIAGPDGRSRSITRPLTQDEVAKYRKRKQAYLKYKFQTDWRKKTLKSAKSFASNMMVGSKKHIWMPLIAVGLAFAILRGFNRASRKEEKEEQPETATKPPPTVEKTPPSARNIIARTTITTSRAPSEPAAPSVPVAPAPPADPPAPAIAPVIPIAPIAPSSPKPDVQGSFMHFSQTAFIQMLSQSNETGELLLISDDVSSVNRLFLLDGKIIDADNNSETGEKAALSILSNTTIHEFKFFKRKNISRINTIESSTMALLLEVQRMQDEDHESLLDFSDSQKSQMDWSDKENILSKACSKWSSENDAAGSTTQVTGQDQRRAHKLYESEHHHQPRAFRDDSAPI